ncbi:hypothetical protein [Mycoplasma miroungirhinis]|uniref:Uncharacterized protein n=1 Tax=Mycoplasma miroungirhinis TaxID=754516 RepID=A0A6M4JAH8_9MOLU|nr:hypothetical protein [Mycoplasma miroungirhinis]QJR43900.1 hypothetical protein HLA92_00285 [Mycoplasma miroungirhinis]
MKRNKSKKIDKKQFKKMINYLKTPIGKKVLISIFVISIVAIAVITVSALTLQNY